MNVLYEMYNGNITPSQKYIKGGGEYGKLVEELAGLTEILVQNLDCNTKKLWQEVCDTQSAMEQISDRESFVDGFCTGARVMLEILSKDPTDRNVL